MQWTQSEMESLKHDWILRLLLLSFTVVLCVRAQPKNSPQPHCSAITSELCRGNGALYNTTKFPNLLGHETQEEAELEIKQFFPLIKIKCSERLITFLCSMYFPFCSENWETVLPPCRGLCEDAEKGCAPLMRKFGFQWPEKFTCNSFQEEGMCVKVPSQEVSGVRRLFSLGPPVSSTYNTG